MENRIASSFRVHVVSVIFFIILIFSSFCFAEYNINDLKSAAIASDIDQLREILAANPDKIEEIVRNAVGSNPDIAPAIAELVGETYPDFASEIAALITGLLPEKALDIYKAAVDGISTNATDIQKYATDSDKYSEKIRQYDHDIDGYIMDTKEKVKEAAEQAGIYSPEEFEQLVAKIDAYEPPTRYIPPKNPIVRDYFHRPSYAQ